MTEETLLKKTEKLINKYIRDELKYKMRIEKEWKKEDLECQETNTSPNYPKIYSNQYFSFIELQSFWNKLKNKLMKENFK